MGNSSENIHDSGGSNPSGYSSLTGQNAEFSSFARRIQNKYNSYPWSPLLKKESIKFIKELIFFLFPHFSGGKYSSAKEILSKLESLKKNLVHLIKLLGDENPGNISEIAEQFVHKLPNVYNKLWKDANAICQGDPAAKSMNEVIIAYPGFLAIAIYRIAHELSVLSLPVIPRILTEYAHSITGIDIHPGAQIGSPFVIDHGTGVVIGESSIIGNNVKMYHGVTLGALTVDKNLAQTKRHPTIEDDVVIYSHAVILGGNTVIGKKCTIGGNTWITRSIPPNTVVYNKTEVRVRTNESENEIQ
jgi:serine O-acetyltransferase